MFFRKQCLRISQGQHFSDAIHLSRWTVSVIILKATCVTGMTTELFSPLCWLPFTCNLWWERLLPLLVFLLCFELRVFRFLVLPQVQVCLRSVLKIPQLLAWWTEGKGNARHIHHSDAHFPGANPCIAVCLSALHSTLKDRLLPSEGSQALALAMRRMVSCDAERRGGIYPSVPFIPVPAPSEAFSLILNKERCFEGSCLSLQIRGKHFRSRAARMSGWPFFSIFNVIFREGRLVGNNEQWKLSSITRGRI